MICPKCRKNYSIRSPRCPFCGNPTARERSASGEINRQSAPEYNETGRKRRAGRTKKKVGVAVTVIVWLCVLAILAVSAVLYFSGWFDKKTETSVGERFIGDVLSGNADDAAGCLPYDAKKLYADNWRAVFRDDHGSDFESFYKKYRVLGIRASDIDSFIEGAYSKLNSDFRLSMANLIGGSFSSEITVENERHYEKNEVADYVEKVKEHFSDLRVDISDYIDLSKINAVTETTYLISVAEGGAGQSGKYRLHSVRIGEEWYVMPALSAVVSDPGQSGEVSGRWALKDAKEPMVFTIGKDGSGSIESGGKTVPAEFVFIGSDAMRISSAAFAPEGGISGDIVCRYSVEDGVLTLTLVDGVMAFDRVE